MRQEAISVGSLLGLLKQSLGRAFRTVLVTGEVLDPLVSQRGHFYFRLTDGNSEVRAVMWKRDAARLRGIPEAGTMVTVRATLDIYAPRGDLQLMVMALMRSGRGQKMMELSRLKERLRSEGLFDRVRRQLPAFPKSVGLVTSAGSAVLHDVYQSLQKRYPGSSLLLSPAQVSGTSAAVELVQALERLRGRTEVVILGRGGGSFEELLPFSDERLVRAVAEFPQPVVAAVGHGSDTTLVDLVADHTAPTPTAAAVLVTPDREELSVQLELLRNRLRRQLRRRLEGERQNLREWSRRCGRSHPALRVSRYRQELIRLKGRLKHRAQGGLQGWDKELQSLLTQLLLRHPAGRVERARSELELSQGALQTSMKRNLERERANLNSLAERLRGVGPEAVLKRGFALVKAGQDLVTSVEGRTLGEELELHLADGVLVVKIAGLQRPGTKNERIADPNL